jgi:hypothetical protein
VVEERERGSVVEDDLRLHVSVHDVAEDAHGSTVWGPGKVRA